MKNILIGITGSIAAYKICELTRMFKREGFEVKTILTPNAKEFVTPLTLETLSQNQVFLEQFSPRDKTEHISLANWAEVFILAPLSANTLSKISNGICDNLLTSVFCAYLGTKKPAILAPAMNTGMWNNPFVKKNLEELKKIGCEILEPECGFLACGVENKGRLCSLDTIFNAVKKQTQKKPLEGKKIVITSGGTKEKIDPVRFISNASSGKTGVALAKTAIELGAEVELITTVENNLNCKKTYIQSALEMLEATKKSFIENNADFLIMAAAVGDFRVKNICDKKITKDEQGEGLTLELVQNPDILKNICQLKKDSQKVIGFCLSSENAVETAKKKIKNKGCDYIIANETQALGSDENEIWIIDKNLDIQKIKKTSKENIALKILEKLYD